MRQHHHHTDEEVETYITKGVELVERLDVPDDLRAIALGHALMFYSAKQVFYTQEDAQPLQSGIAPFLNQRGH